MVAELYPGVLRQPGGLVGHAAAHQGQVKGLLLGESLVVQILGELRLAHDPQELVGKTALVGQLPLECFVQETFLQAALDLGMGGGEVGDTLPQTVGGVAKGVVPLFLGGQGPEHQQDAPLKDRDRHPVGDQGRGHVDGVAGVLGQGEEQVRRELLVLEQLLTGFVGIHSLPLVEEDDCLWKCVEEIVQAGGNGIHDISSLEIKIGYPIPARNFRPYSVTNPGNNNKDFVRFTGRNGKVFSCRASIRGGSVV